MSALRVAIVGAGVWGRQHAQAFSRREDTEVVGVFSRNLVRAIERAGTVGAHAYDDLDRMLEKERPDLVSVCLPNTQHFAATLHLIRRDVQLLVEKPLVFDVEEGRQLISEAAARHTFFAINFNHRFAEPTVRARRALDDGLLGSLTFASWRFGGEGRPDSGPDGNLIETQCHGFDMLEHLAGPIASVSAEMTDFAGRGHSTVAIALRFTSGAVGSLLGSYDSSYAYPGAQSVEVNGTRGRVLITDTVKRYEYSQAGVDERTVWEAGYFDDRGREFHATFERHLDELVPALARGEQPPVHASAGLRALQLADASIRSFRTGRRVATGAGLISA